MSKEELLHTTKSKRIAKNSILLFIRMFLIIVINLYAVRIIIKGLGDSDYGTFNAVAGMVLAGSILTTSLAIAIQRFYSYAIGENILGRLQEIFSASMNIIFVTSLVVIVILETVGLWFLNNLLSVPPERLAAANWIFQFTLVSFLFSMLQLPYTASIFAHEDMGFFALISFLECMLKFLVAVLIDQVSIDALVYYGAGLMVVSIVIFLMYSITARKNYSECRYTKVADKTIYPQLASFSGWTMYSALAGVVTTQGNTILLNVFFGPLTTAAFAISLQISHAFQALSNSIVLAFRPAMIILYAEKNYGGLNWLFDASNKFLLYLLLSVSVPIACEIRTIFNWWLGPVSEETILFARLFIIYIILMVMHNPVTTIVQATGQVKKYTFYVESIMLLCLVFAFVAFKMGWSSYYAIVSLIVVSAIAHIVRLVMLHQLYPSFHVSHYMRSIVLPAVAITIVTIGITLTAHMYTDNAIVRFLAVFFLSLIVTLGLAYAIGTNKTEKRQVKQLVQQLINRRRI